MTDLFELMKTMLFEAVEAMPFVYFSWDLEMAEGLKEKNKSSAALPWNRKDIHIRFNALLGVQQGRRNN